MNKTNLAVLIGASISQRIPPAALITDKEDGYSPIRHGTKSKFKQNKRIQLKRGFKTRGKT